MCTLPEPAAGRPPTGVMIPNSRTSPPVSSRGPVQRRQAETASGAFGGRWNGHMRRGRIVAGLVLVAGIASGAAVAASRSARPGALGRFPLAVVVDQRTARTFVANYGGASISVLDTDGMRLVRTVPMPGLPSALSVDESMGRIMVASVDRAGNSGTVSLLNAADGTIVHSTVVGVAPVAVAIDERLHHAFVLNLDSSTISVLDTYTGRLLHTATVNLLRQAWRETPICRGLNATQTCYSVRTAERLSTMQIGNALESARQSPQGLVVDPARGRAFLVATYRDSVLVLDTRSGALLRTIKVGAAPCALTFDPSSGHAIVTNLDSNTVSFIDLGTGAVLHTATVGQAPGAVTFDVGTGHTFVANFGDGTVSVLDTPTARIVNTVPVGMGPTAIAVDSRRGQVVVTAISGSAGSAQFPVDSGSVHILDARSGTVLRTIPVDDDPNAIAMDERGGRAYVVSALVRLPPATKAPGGWDTWWRRWLPFLTPSTPDPTVGTIRAIDTTGL